VPLNTAKSAVSAMTRTRDGSRSLRNLNPPPDRNEPHESTQRALSQLTSTPA
jgi:hypothetical protein